jgi:hypothetical protein
MVAGDLDEEIKLRHANKLTEGFVVVEKRRAVQTVVGAVRLVGFKRALEIDEENTRRIVGDQNSDLERMDKIWIKMKVGSRVFPGSNPMIICFLIGV